MTSGQWPADADTLVAGQALRPAMPPPGHIEDDAEMAGQPVPKLPSPPAMTGIVQPRGPNGAEPRCLGCRAVQPLVCASPQERMIAMTQTLNASDVDARDLNQVAALAETLPQGSPLAVVMQDLVATIRKGQDVTVLAMEEHLTPNQAADLLHVSRPHLLKFMDSGELAFYRVGNRRRIRMDDLLDFIARRERAKATVASAFGNPNLVEKALRDGAAELTNSDIDELNAL